MKKTLELTSPLKKNPQVSSRWKNQKIIINKIVFNENVYTLNSNPKPRNSNRQPKSKNT